MHDTITQSDLPFSPVNGLGGQDGKTSSAAWTVDARLDVAAALAWLLATFGPTIITAIHPDTGRIESRYLNHATLGDVTRWASREKRPGVESLLLPKRTDARPEQEARSRGTSSVSAAPPSATSTPRTGERWMGHWRRSGACPRLTW